MDEEKTKLEQVLFRLQFRSLCNAAGRLDDMNKSFLIAWELVEELVEEEKELKEKDVDTCIRCGVVLDTDEGVQTGICPTCWKPEIDEEVEFVDGEWKPKLELP